MLCALAACLAAHAPAGAAASLPWTPTATARHQLQRLVDEAGLDLPVTQWPLPRAAVIDALQRLPAALPEPLAAARDELADELAEAGSALATLRLRNPRESLAGFGDDATPGSSATLRSAAFGSEVFAAQLGVRVAREGTARDVANVDLEGSAVAAEALGIVWQAWSRRSWWGPGWQSSLILGNNAPALAGVSLQRAAATTSHSRWLHWMGPWNAEFFVARLDGVGTPAHPYLVGMRWTLRPWPLLEIGLTRTAQWGGRGRPQSLRSFTDMLTGRDLNADTPEQQARDPANAMAGIDLRARCPAAMRCAAYLQLIGEDQGGVLPSRYLGLYGVEFWSAQGDHRGFIELAETGCRMPLGRTPDAGCAYRNYAYREGYVNAQRWLGAAAGPDSRFLTLGWIDAARNASLRLHYGRIGSRIGVFSALTRDPDHAGLLVGASLRRGLSWRGLLVEPELSWLRIETATGMRTQARAGIGLRLRLPP